jgi:hypothetical protein
MLHGVELELRLAKAIQRELTNFYISPQTTWLSDYGTKGPSGPFSGGACPAEVV